MSASAESSLRRLMFTLDAGLDAPGAAALALDLAASIGLELHGVFVEDIDLLRLAQLPIAREVGGSSAHDRPLPREALESALRRRTARAAGALERAGKQLNVPVHWRTARGKVVRHALEHGEHGDVVLVAPPRISAGAEWTRGLHRPGGALMVWLDDAAWAQPSLDVAAHLLRRRRSELALGVSASRFGSDAEAYACISASLAQAAGAVRISRVAADDADALMQALRAARAVQLILPAASKMARAEVLERVLAELPEGLILVR
jgi:hypothetical protein